eukprot:1194184-Prorocentrum_minimum.AAC.4
MVCATVCHDPALGGGLASALPARQRRSPHGSLPRARHGGGFGNRLELCGPRPGWGTRGGVLGWDGFFGLADTASALMTPTQNIYK